LQESPLLLGNYGFDTYLDGLVKKDPVLLERELKSAQGAIALDLDEQYLYLRYNVAVAQLALGNIDMGLQVYAETAKKEGYERCWRCGCGSGG